LRCGKREDFSSPLLLREEPSLFLFEEERATSPPGRERTAASFFYGLEGLAPIFKPFFCCDGRGKGKGEEEGEKRRRGIAYHTPPGEAKPRAPFKT